MDKNILDELSKILSNPFFVKKEGDCLRWRGKHSYGYGIFHHDGNTYYMHRVAVDIAGVYREGLDIHHICKTKDCVNIDHLKVMSRSDHIAEHGR